MTTDEQKIKELETSCAIRLELIQTANAQLKRAFEQFKEMQTLCNISIADNKRISEQLTTLQAKVTELETEKEDLKGVLGEVAEEVKGFGFGEHPCYPEKLRHRCQECNTNKEVESILTLIQNKLGAK